jgi:hypothetical protein
VRPVVAGSGGVGWAEVRPTVGRHRFDSIVERNDRSFGAARRAQTPSDITHLASERWRGPTDPSIMPAMTSPTKPRHRAVLIGAPTRGLKGVLNDVATMRKELEAWGFACDELAGPAATREGILGALRELVEWAATNDDVIAIYYSGHGGWYRLLERADEPPGPPTGFLVPTDIEADRDFRPIIDLELAVIVDDLARRTKNVTVILDCCHSAGLFREHEMARALKERVIEPGPLQDSLLALAGRSRVLHPEGHPDVVRVVATASASSAFEFQPEQGPSGGYLTHELCAALAEARQVPLPWETIIGQVRERVADRRGSTTQRPEVEGPRRRLPFSLYEPAYDGERSVLVYGSDDAPWARAGRLHGLSKGDRVEVQDGEAVVATGRIVALLDDSTRLELDPITSGRKPALGSTVVPRSLALRKTVRVEPDALAAAGPLTGLERSPRLSVVVDGEDADFVVSLEDGGLCVSGQSWLRRLPWPATPDGIASLVDELDGLARTEILLAALASPPGLTAGSSPIDWEVEVFVTEPGRDSPRPLAAGEVLHEGVWIYAELRHLSRGGPILYVDVLDRDASGRLQLINESEPAGVQLRALETRWVGRRRHGGPPGLELRWPDLVPRDGIGHEELIFVVSQRPLDLRSLLEGPRASRGSRPQAQLRGTPADEVGTPLPWTVARVSFGVSP